MSEIEWSKAVEAITPHIYQIFTPELIGTGFLLSKSKVDTICGIATAAHVVRHSNEWKQPIIIRDSFSDSEYYFEASERAIIINEELDTAVIIIDTENIEVPKVTYPLSPKGMHLKIGIEGGWLRFPALSPSNLCFFHGRISTYLQMNKSYLVNGVAINGVSGGPAFTLDEKTTLTIMGLVSAYIPNKATGEVLPGLCMLSDVIQLQNIAKAFKTLDQAKEMEKNQPIVPKFKSK